MKQSRQLPLFKPSLRFFGGRLLEGKRKSQRPLSTKDSIHIVMRSSWARGRTSFLRKYNRKAIERLIDQVAKRYGVRVYEKALASNHIHLVVKIPHRRQYAAFIRVLSGKIATHVMRKPLELPSGEVTSGCERSYAEFMKGEGWDAALAGKTCANRARSAQVAGDVKLNEASVSNHHINWIHEPQGKEQKFWQYRPFTRVLHWGRDFKQCCAYLIQNTLEAFGFVAYTPRKDRYAKWVNETLGFS